LPHISDENSPRTLRKIARCSNGQCDNYSLKSHKHERVTTYQTDTKSNPNFNPTAKQHAIVNIQLNIVTCPTYLQTKFFRDHVVAPSVLLSVVIVTLPF